MTEGSISNVLQKVLDSFSDLRYRVDKQTSYLENLQSEESKYKPHETWNSHEENFVCYEEDESHKYPHLFHTANPQLNNIACMLAYIIKNCCYQNFHQRMDEFQEEQKRNIENIYIKLEVLSKLLENKEEYLTLNELSQFLKKGEDKGKQIEIPQNQPQEKISKLEETSESTQLRIKPPSNYF
jgi:hypothetical protein